MSISQLSIGALAARSGTNAPTIRYYEDIGLLRRPHRSGSGRRVYDESDVRRLGFIRSCRDFGLSIDQCRALLEIIEQGDRSCLDARAVVQARLEDIRARIDQLHLLEQQLSAFVEECDKACSGAPSADCVVLEGIRLSTSG